MSHGTLNAWDLVSDAFPSLSSSLDAHSIHALPTLLAGVPPRMDGLSRERLFDVMKANIYITQVSGDLGKIGD